MRGRLCHAVRTGLWRTRTEGAADRKPLPPSPQPEVCPLSRSHVERFAVAGVRHAFRFRSGASFDGWVEEVGEDATLVEWAPSPFNDPTGDPTAEWVRFADIEPASLAYWDEAAERWVDFPPPAPVTFANSWRSETVVALAAGIRADGAFDRLPILADALEEAGCDDPDILAHCRVPDHHVRGYWVVALVLGNEPAGGPGTDCDTPSDSCAGY